MGTEPRVPASSAIRLKRAYEAPGADDGVRILVDRLWARGLSKVTARLDVWMKELGPSGDLRKWFGHQPDRWDAFVEHYRQELATGYSHLSSHHAWSGTSRSAGFTGSVPVRPVR